MKAVVVRSFEDIRVEERDIPKIGDGEILVRTKVCGICSGDLMKWYIEKKAPLVLGHEPAGVVEVVGKGVKDFKAGDRVFVHHHAPCLKCIFCRRGAYSMCEVWKNSRIDPGGMADYFRVPAENLADTLILPEKVSFEGGALIEPVACGVKAIRRSGLLVGDKVLVIGLGIMGLILVKLAKLAGAVVIGSDFSAQRRQRALEIGADLVVDPTESEYPMAIAAGGSRPDVVYVGPPNIEAIMAGLDAVESGGTVLMFSPARPGERLEINQQELYFRDISLVPSYSCGPNDTREALNLFASGDLKPEEFITHRYHLEDAPRAFREMAAGGEVIKSVVTF